MYTFHYTIYLMTRINLYIIESMSKQKNIDYNAKMLNVGKKFSSKN